MTFQLNRQQKKEDRVKAQPAGLIQQPPFVISLTQCNMRGGKAICGVFLKNLNRSSDTSMCGTVLNQLVNLWSKEVWFSESHH